MTTSPREDEFSVDLGWQTDAGRSDHPEQALTDDEPGSRSGETPVEQETALGMLAEVAEGVTTILVRLDAIERRLSVLEAMWSTGST